MASGPNADEYNLVVLKRSSEEEGLPVRISTNSTDATCLSDPLALGRYKKCANDLKKLRNTNPELFKFYEHQNTLIHSFLNPLEDDGEEKEAKDLRVKIAVYGSFSVNFMLFTLQLVAAISSGSLALFATAADGFMDVCSNFVMLITSKISAQKNYLMYPTGKARFETAGIIVFSTLMSTLSLQIIVQIF